LLFVDCLSSVLRERMPGRFGSRRRCRTLRIGETLVRWELGRKSDFEVLDEILNRDIYAERLVPPPTTIVDLGSHIGFSVLFFRSRFPDARILAVEPQPESAAVLRRNVASLGNVEVLERAVAPEDGVVRFFEAEQPWQSSLLRGPASANEIQVRALTLDQLLSQAGVAAVDLLKVDIEGVEVEVLRGSEAVKSARCILIELHPSAEGDEVGALRSALPGFVVDTSGPTVRAVPSPAAAQQDSG
jgi:FkbM family methyltransferase